MTQTTIDRLIINSPYTEPSRHWRYQREAGTFSLAEGRFTRHGLAPLPPPRQAPVRTNKTPKPKSRAPSPVP